MLVRNPGVCYSFRQVSLKGLAELAAVQCTLMPLRQFVDCSCGQFALLGLQLSWTAQVRMPCAMAPFARPRVWVYQDRHGTTILIVYRRHAAKVFDSSPRAQQK